MTTARDISLADLIAVLSETHALHAPTTSTHHLLEKIAESVFSDSKFRSPEPEPVAAGPFGSIVFPFVSMGAVNSVDLISSLNELVIFAFYWVNRKRYRKAVDVGANLGLHSILMSRLGWEVTAYEPDPVHFSLLRRNADLNGLKRFSAIEAALAEQAGTSELVRVLGNTTSSHLSGSKDSPYGELERIPVNVVGISGAIADVDFVKIDAEGKERALIEAMTATDFGHLDVIVEVGSEENADAIYRHLSRIGVKAFSQKIGWQVASSPADVPVNYKEGSLFVSSKESMPWLP